MLEKDFGFTRKTVFITLLVTLFILDDILIYILFKNIYSWKVDLIYFGVGAIIVLTLNVGLAFVVFKIMRKKPTTGQQGMIGKQGVVLKNNRSEYQVRIQGEIWRSESSEILRAGDKVMVDSVNGLCLIVRKTDVHPY